MTNRFSVQHEDAEWSDAGRSVGPGIVIIVMLVASASTSIVLALIGMAVGMGFCG
jgi:Na+/proline symporter